MAGVANVPHSPETPKETRGRYRSAGAMVAFMALGLAILLLFILGMLIGFNQDILRTRFAWVQHTDEVLLQVSGIRLDLLRMESDIRAYGLTDDASHIREWGELRTETQARLAKLAALVSDNQEQVRRLSRLRPQIDDWISRWAPYAGAGVANPSVTAAAGLRQELARDAQNRPARNFHAALDAFGSVELGLLQQRQLVAQKQSFFLTYLSFFVALCAPTCGALGMYLLMRERNQARSRELQMQLEHSQRLGLMGETASMLAHELSQPLAAAQNYLAVLKRSLANPEAERQSLIAQSADDQLRRAGGVLQRLRNFIEKRVNDRQEETAAVLVADAISLLGTIDANLQFHTRLEPDLPPVLVDRIQIQQILVNLMRNSIEAMTDSPRKELWLSVARAPANMIEFRLRDTGPGISPAVRERLFRPFTSTKKGGMGIGLSICRGIVRDHNGDMWAASTAGEGATLCFTLPVAGQRP